MLSWLRPDHAHEPAGTAVTPAAARIALMTGTRRPTLGTVGLRAAAITELRMIHERKTALANWAVRHRREWIAGTNFGRLPDIWATRIREGVEPCVTRGKTSTTCKRSRMTGVSGSTRKAVPAAPDT